MDGERCLLRLFVVSCAIDEGELDDDGGVSIALVVVQSESAKSREALAKPQLAAYTQEAPNIQALATRFQ